MAAMAAALLGLDPKSKEAAMLLMKGTLGTKPEDGKRYNVLMNLATFNVILLIMKITFASTSTA